MNLKRQARSTIESQSIRIRCRNCREAAGDPWRFAAGPLVLSFYAGGCAANARFVCCQSRERSPTIRPVNFRDKILPLEAVAGWRRALRGQGKTLVVTNGCFDILHAGHVTYLDAARQQGDTLLVGLNSDASVRQLKGEQRPVNPDSDRAAVVAALEAVDAVCIFPELRATRFLSLAQPDIYVKGGDFAVEELPKEERDIVAACGGRIVTIGFVPGKSTTVILEKVAGL